MKALLTRDASRSFDRRIIDAGVPGLLLMENAGRGAADLLLSRMSDRLERVLVVGGTGQNGGDAWVIARRLVTRGHAPRVVLAGRRADVKGDALQNLHALDALAIPVTEIGDASELAEVLAGVTLIVDGLFGTGLDRPIEGWRAGLVDALNACEAPIFAIDLPSGIDADTGAILGVAIAAELTATFAGHKRGHWQMPGRALRGEVVCLDIGVPGPREDGLLELADAAGWLPQRALHSHKGVAGHVVVFAGAPGRIGAARLCGHGALRGGAGLVTLAARGEAARALDQGVHELMTFELPDAETSEGVPAGGALAAALGFALGKQAAVVGPGLGLDPGGRALSLGLAAKLPIPAVLDADALSALADAGLESLKDAMGPRVLTPHPGEAGRLLGLTSEQVQADRYRAARRLAERSGHVVVLKGAGTIVADPDGRLAVCPLGTPALGVAGTGDVLAGMLAAVLAAAEPFEAACASVLLHARAGELAACSDRGLLAREVADRAPAALEEARRDRLAIVEGASMTS